MEDKLLEATESTVATMIGEAYTGEPPETTSEGDAKFEFDAEFQSRITALALRDNEFMRRAAHLVKPEFFENAGEASLVNIAVKYYEKYKHVPDIGIYATLIKEQIVSKVIRKDIIDLVKDAFKAAIKANIGDREFIEEKVAEFARHQAVSQAILRAVDLIDQKKFDKIEKDIKNAIEIGINEDGDAYNYFENIASRTSERLDEASGVKPPRGVTSGNIKLDEILYHRGWGRRELVSIMGGAKSGKTTALIGFAKAASLKGYNTLYVTLEVSARIIAERLDASISDTMIKELGKHIHDVKAKVEALEERSGELVIHEYPSGTFTPNMLRALLERYRGKGVKFDLVVVDYADIMAPNFRYNDVIENSKSVYVDLRAIATQEDVAMLTATQTNREGYKATVAKAEHVAEDFNKVRTVDLMISINVTDEERSRGEARLYFAASRNQESGFTIFIKQDLSKMRFIESVLRVE